LKTEIPLSNRELIGYATATVPSMFAYILVLVMYMKYAVDVLGASAAVIGSIFLFARVWDAVSDPIVGSWSDRTHSAHGRRRPWLYASAPLIALFGLMAWVPPSGLEGVALTAWIGVAIVGFYTAFTMFEVPHSALGAEVTFDRSSRNRIFGFRQAFRTLGMFAGVTLGAYLVETGRIGAAWMAGGLAIALVLLIVGGVAQLPSERVDFKGRGGDHPFRAVGDVFRNEHARLLLFVFFIENMGAGGIGVLAPFVIQYVLMMGGHFVPIMLAAYMVSALVAVPVWVRLSSTFEKRRLWLFSMIQGGVGFGLILWVGEGDWLLILVSAVLAGSAGACGSTLGYSLKAEVIDYDEYRTGERKEGTYFATWSFMSKLANGLMVGLVGFSLEASGFVPNASEQTEVAKSTMLFLMGGVPMLGYAIGGLAFSRFQLSESEHARIRAALDSR
jgi:GPH family glycoside/pentoside/hexuronide:cation symporter